jgi:SAM-dependent methyltransferase
VLDVGYGYGRVALPLARAGYEIEGLDLSENLIESACRAAGAEGLSIGLTVGSMTNLPYGSESFDALICLWSAFNELLEEEERVRAIREMWRVLRRGGVGVIEGRPYTKASAAEIKSGTRRGSEHRVEWGLVEGILNPHYRHDRRSFERVCTEAGVSHFKVFEREWAVRLRLFLRLEKPGR